MKGWTSDGVRETVFIGVTGCILRDTKVCAAIQIIAASLDFKPIPCVGVLMQNYYSR